jgi:hypothetical protein
MRAGYPPVIIHATERQRYYESLKGTANNASRLITEALAATVESTVRLFEQSELEAAVG